jgi:uracil-DNA glycosylase family 4
LHLLQQLNDRITACQQCTRLRQHCRTIAITRKREFASQSYWALPVTGFGDPEARLLIVGLAPGAHGSNRTGRVFTGDASGVWLYEALHRYGWANQPNAVGREDGLRLTDCYITAAARCAPPANRPNGEELARCRPFLEEEIRLLTNVRMVLALGRVGWEAWLRAAGWWDRLRPHERPRFSHGAEAMLPDGMVLMASFHPSRQNTNTGRLTRPMWHGVFERIRTAMSQPHQQPASPGDQMAEQLPAPQPH